MRWIIYLVISLRRLIGYAGGSSEFTQWKLGFLLLLMETIVVYCTIWAAFEAVLDAVNSYVVLFAIVLPLLAINQPLIAAGNSAKHAKEFARLTRLQRSLLGIAALVLVVGTFAMPFIVQELKTGHL